jgi:translation initiation factor 2B subunit (eIF-2B alpha/beta/delta family)
VTVVNRYFEAVPLAFFTGLVTAAGILTPDQVRRRVSALEIHPALLG